MLLFLICLLISALINIHISKGTTFLRGIFNDWGSILNVLTSSLIFLFILNLNLARLSINAKKIIVKISELSFGMYLTSWIIDNFLYFNHLKDIDLFSITGYFKIVALVFTLSISLSMIINIIYKIINKYIIRKITM